MPTVTPRGTERLRERLAALSAISQAMARPADLDTLAWTIYRETTRGLDATLFILGLYDEASETVTVVKQIEGGVEFPVGSFPLGSGFTSQVIRTRQPRLIRQWSREGPQVQIQFASGQPGLPESGITVPLVCHEQVLGVLSMQSYEPSAYDEDDVLMLLAIAGQAAVAVENLTRSERLDAQLRRRVSELEVILASMTDALLIVDADGRIVRLNHAARELLSPGGNGIILGHPVDSEQWGQWSADAEAIAAALAPLIEALQRGEALRDVEVDLKIERRRVLSVSSAPLDDGTDAPVGGVIVVRDVTGRREIERLKDEVLSIASHDLRSPVTVVKGTAQLVERKVAAGEATPAAVTKGLRVIARQADRLIELLNLLLDLSRLEAGRLELQPRPTDLVALAQVLAEDVQAAAERHLLVVRGPASAEGVWDEQRVKQVLQNLLTNAIKYSPDGGAVEVTIEVDEQRATVRVRDEGVGLAPEELRHIFERFYRAETTRRLEGAGLGLYICQAIIAAHGGRIWAESAGSGRGSTFCFTLPRGGTGLNPGQTGS